MSTDPLSGLQPEPRGGSGKEFYMQFGTASKKSPALALTRVHLLPISGLRGQVQTGLSLYLCDASPTSIPHPALRADISVIATPSSHNHLHIPRLLIDAGQLRSLVARGREEERAHDAKLWNRAERQPTTQRGGESARATGSFGESSATGERLPARVLERVEYLSRHGPLHRQLASSAQRDCT